MTVRTVDIQIHAGKLLDLYRMLFAKRFSDAPIIDVGAAMEVCKWLVSNVGYEKICALMPRYFQIDDEWIQNQGFSLEYFKNNINKVIARTAKTGLNIPQYVVAYTASGRPVLSCNPAEMARENYRFIPMLLEDWKKASIAEKLQSPREKWEVAGNNIDLWIENWSEYGFLPAKEHVF